MSRTTRTWTLAELLAEKTVEVGDCLEWTGSMGGIHARLPQLSSGCRCYNARRFAWALAHDIAPPDLPPKLNVWHTCKNWRCINPAHLAAGTRNQMCAALTKQGVFKLGADAVARRTEKARKRCAKITPDAARRIRTSTDSCVKRAAIEGCSPSLVSLIRRGLSWRESPVSRAGFALQSVWLGQPSANDHHLNHPQEAAA